MGILAKWCFCEDVSSISCISGDFFSTRTLLKNPKHLCDEKVLSLGGDDLDGPFGRLGPGRLRAPRPKELQLELMETWSFIGFNSFFWGH